MFKKHLHILAVGLLMSSVVFLLVACGGDDDDDDTSSPTATTAAAQPTLEPTATEPAEATEPDEATAESDSSGDSDLVAQGKVIFDETAGGVGCASCHGMDGRGDPNMGAPNIRGASASQVRSALGGAVPVMSFINLSEDELQAVVAYLQELAE